MEKSASLVRDFGEKGIVFMSKETIYTDAPKEIAQALLESEETIDDLPSPDKLVRRYPKTKVTITLNTRSVNFFKQYAQKNHVKYQTMINDVLDSYAQKYDNRISNLS